MPEVTPLNNETSNNAEIFLQRALELEHNSLPILEKNKKLIETRNKLADEIFDNAGLSEEQWDSLETQETFYLIGKLFGEEDFGEEDTVESLCAQLSQAAEVPGFSQMEIEEKMNGFFNDERLS